MRYQHRVQVHAPASVVADFHSQTENMVAITPPFVPVQLGHAPAHPEGGDQMAFTMWLGPIPVRWRTYFSQVSDTGFTDTQLEGPFRYWVHRHTFLPLDGQTTEVVDEVRAALRWHILWGIVGLMMWLGLPVLFAYRGWKTRRLLEERGGQ
jgi:ligand-binding SRPBCC domain-containing protein